LDSWLTDRDEQGWVAAGGIHHVCVAGGGARVGVAEQFLHGAQVAGVQVTQGSGGMTQGMAGQALALQAGGVQVAVGGGADVAAAKAVSLKATIQSHQQGCADPVARYVPRSSR